MCCCNACCLISWGAAQALGGGRGGEEDEATLGWSGEESDSTASRAGKSSNSFFYGRDLILTVTPCTFFSACHECGSIYYPCCNTKKERSVFPPYFITCLVCNPLFLFFNWKTQQEFKKKTKPSSVNLEVLSNRHFCFWLWHQVLHLHLSVVTSYSINVIVRSDCTEQTLSV